MPLGQGLPKAKALPLRLCQRPGMPRSKGPLGSRHVRRLTIGPGRGEGRAPPWSLVVTVSRRGHAVAHPTTNNNTPEE